MFNQIDKNCKVCLIGNYVVFKNNYSKAAMLITRHYF